VSRNRGTRSGVGNRARSPRPGALPPLNGQSILNQVFANRMIPAPPGEGGPNPGLVFERYLRIWHRENRLKLLGEDRLGALALFVEQYEECRAMLDPLLQEIHTRLDRLRDAQAVSKRSFKTQERLVCGLGASHPLENGFAFDYVLGVPFLPGSSIKGLARQYSYYEVDETVTETLFGPEQNEEEERRSDAGGDVLFFAAYPEEWPKLNVDIINCHYPGYYGSEPLVDAHTDTEDRRERKVQRSSSSKLVGPIEYESPIPVFFLTVAKGTSFVFRCGSRSGYAENARQALVLVEKGLKEFGIGAKTALGYGVME
jgi:CRISPR-associated protein Cmr6